MTLMSPPKAPDRLSPIDLDHLVKQVSGDRGVLIEILTLYHTLAPRYLSALEHSTTLAQLGERLHVLKSAAAGIGAWGVQDRARQIELNLKKGRPLDPEWIDDLAVTVEEGVRYIEALMESGERLPGS
jgi:hypothetical protein